jgi:hypothetical protein
MHNQPPPTRYHWTSHHSTNLLNSRSLPRHRVLRASPRAPSDLLPCLNGLYCRRLAQVVTLSFTPRDLDSPALSIHPSPSLSSAVEGPGMADSLETAQVLRELRVDTETRHPSRSLDWSAGSWAPSFRDRTSTPRAQLQATAARDMMTETHSQKGLVIPRRTRRGIAAHQAWWRDRTTPRRAGCVPWPATFSRCSKSGQSCTVQTRFST